MAEHECSRRRFLRASLLLGGAGMLAACGGAPAAPAPTAAPNAPAPTAGGAPAAGAQTSGGQAGITLSILNENWGDVYNKLMTVIGDDFTKDNPGITLEWNFDPDWTTKLTTLVAAGTPPDATFMRAAPLTTFAPKGALMDLGPLLHEAGYKREDFVLPLYDSSVSNGKLYAIPGGADWWCLFWSKDAYRDAGLDPEKPPATFDELIGHSKQLLKKDNNGDIQRIGYNPTSSHLPNWFYIFGGQLYDADKQKVTANHPANVEALARLQEYMQLLDVNKLAAFNQRPGAFEAGNPFSTRQAAFLFDGFWTYEALDQYSPDIDYAVTFWPTLKGTEEERKNYMTGGWMYSLPTKTAHADAAWKFLRYIFLDHSAEMGYKTLNGTCIKAQFPQWEAGVKAKMGANNRMAPYLSKFTETGGAATRYFPPMPAQAYYQDELNRVYDLVMRGEQTPQAALDEVTKNVQAELEKAMKG
jgi:multiple sugar transport system substrate-binding protein